MNQVTRRRNRPEEEPCPDHACPHPSRLHDERIRAVGQAPCSTCSACAEGDAEDEAEYDHSRAKEDARNAMFPAGQAASDAAALDSIAHMLRDPDWGVGMLEDIGAIVTETGRSIANLPGDEPTWDRH